MFKLLLTTGALFLLSHNTFAWVCPNNFNQIVPGDSLAKVEPACGKPSSQKTTEKEPNVPQEWTYYVTQATQPGVTSGTTGSVKMTIAFANDKVVNITAQATSLSSTSLCGPTISVGNNMETVRGACGDPSFIQKQQSTTGAKSLEVTEYKYDTAPPNTLVFENGILKDRK